MSNNDKFFDMFKDSLEGYSPEVSASVHSGLRSKMRVHNFFKFSISSLNLWTLLAITSVAGAGLWYTSHETNFAEAKQIELPTSNNHIVNRTLVATTETNTFVAQGNDVDIPLIKTAVHIKTNKQVSKKTKKSTPALTIDKKIKKLPNKEIAEENTSTTNPDLIATKTVKKTPTLETENNCKTAAEESNTFNGLIKYDKFQTTTSGLTEEIKNKSKKEFTIKIKVPK